MNTKDFISDLEDYVLEVSKDEGNWDDEYQTIKEYSPTITKDLKSYLDKGIQSEFSDKYFAREVAELFSADPGCVEGYLDDIVKQFNKLWKKYGDKKSMSNNDDSNSDLASRVFSAALSDGTELVTRIAAKQLSRSIAEPVTALLIAGLDLEDNESVRGKIAKFLTSDLGLGLVSFALSFGVEQLPLPALAQGVIKNLGRELRVQGEMAIADPVVEMVGAPLRLMLTEKVLALPIPGLASTKQLMQQNSVSTNNVIDVKTEVEVETKPAKKTVAKKTAKKTVKAKRTVKKTEDSGIKITVKEVKDNAKTSSVN